MKTSPLYVVPVLVALVTLPFLASARMGETEDQSQTRYGAPSTPEIDKADPLVDGMISHTYKYEGWTIRTAFLNGKTVKIKYTRIPTPGTSPKLTNEEVTAILEAEAVGAQWKEVDKKIPNLTLAPKRWIHPNGNTASLDAGEMSITIESPAVAEFKATKKAEVEAKRKSSTPKF